MVKGNHKPFFGLDTVEKILSKLNPKTYYVKSSQTEIGRKLPLRGFLYDLKSGKKFSGGPSEGKKEIYFYYSVRAPQENGKKSLSIDHNIINEGFKEYLQQFKIDKETFVLFEEIMKNIYKQKTAISRNVKEDVNKRITEIDRGIKKLMGRIRKSRSEDMIETYENEIIDLKGEKREIEIRAETNNPDNEIDIDELITNTKVILTNPSFIWDLGDIQLQKMLIGVLFNNKIYYNIKSGFQTPEIPLIYTLLSSSGTDKSGLVEAYLTHRITLKSLTAPIPFDDLYLIIWSPKYLGMSDEAVVAAGAESDYVADIEEEIACLEDCDEEERERNLLKIQILTARKDSMIDRFNKNSGWDWQSSPGHMQEVQKKELTTQLITNENIQHHKREYVTGSQ